MAKFKFKDYICEPFCTFYRAGEKEELACGGALVVERLLKGRFLSTEILNRIKKIRHSSVRRNHTLDLAVCNRCDFKDDGCDFQSGKDLQEAEPCGGYILLDMLMEEEVISHDELEIGNDR